MGYSDHTPPEGESGFAAATPPVGVFVSPRQANDLMEQVDAAARILLLVRAVEPDEAIPFEKLGGLSVAVLEVDPGDRRSVDRLVRLARSKPSFPVIAAITAPDMALVRTLVREGVADVIALPLNIPELTQACLDAVARQAKPAAHVTLAPLVAVVRSTGGSGATTIATHLAAELARLVPARGAAAGKVIVGDLDFQFGSVAAYLGVSRSGSLPDLIDAEDRIDAELLRSIATETPEGLAVLSIPASLPSSDSIPLEGLLRVVERLRSNYALVVLDFPANWTNWSASVAFSADLVLVVTELSLTSIRQARRCLDLFGVIGIPAAKVELVVNKVEKRLFKPIEVGDVGRTLGHAVIATIPRDPNDLARAQDQGMLIGQVTRRSGFAAAITQLAQSVVRKLGIEGGA